MTGGRYLVDGNLWRCTDCDVLVVDREKHDRFHVEREAAADPNQGGLFE